MALNPNFYNEIFEKEQKWIELIDKKLLNSIYCNLTLKPFYLDKKKELEEEYRLSENKIIEQVLFIINNIIMQLEKNNEQYNNFQNVDIATLLPFFLINQMNNTKDLDKNINSNIDQLMSIKRHLEQELQNQNIKSDAIADYVYDDFPEESKKIK